MLRVVRQAIHATSKEMLLAIDGFVVMSSEMEGCYTDIVNNQVPNLWGGITGTAPNYNTVKPLASWVVDLLARMEFIIKWYRRALFTAVLRQNKKHSLTRWQSQV